MGWVLSHGKVREFDCKCGVHVITTSRKKIRCDACAVQRRLQRDRDRYQAKKKQVA